MIPNIQGLALIVFGLGLLVAWLAWAIDSCDGGES